MPGDHEATLPGPLPPGASRDELLAEVGRVMARIPEGATVAAAVSGGPDSTALAFLTSEARPDLTLVLAHVRHGLRDDRFDVAAVQAQASYLGCELDISEVSVSNDGRGIEAAARAQRYAALRRAAREHGAGWLLLGHTADDQAETLLLRIARGTGVPGLGGMPSIRGDVVRPLLRIRRVDVHRFVRMEGLPIAHDPTNRDRTFARNQVRLDLMPLLERYAPDPVGALARLADLARDDASSLRARADDALRGAVRRVGPVACLPLDFLEEHDPAVTRRALRSLVIEARAGGDPPTAAEVEALRALRDGAMDLPGVVVSAAAGWLGLAPAGLRSPEPVKVEVPGVTRWVALGWELHATTEANSSAAGQLQLGMMRAWTPPEVEVAGHLLPPGAVPERGQVVLGGLGSARDSLVVRSRMPGDRIALRVGHRKVKDVMGDAGVPRVVRGLLPLVCHQDRVLWIPGLAADVEALDIGAIAPDVHLAVQPR